MNWPRVKIVRGKTAPLIGRTSYPCRCPRCTKKSQTYVLDEPTDCQKCQDKDRASVDWEYLKSCRERQVATASEDVSPSTAMRYENITSAKAANRSATPFDDGNPGQENAIRAMEDAASVLEDM